MTCKHLMRDPSECVFCERDRLKQEAKDFREIAERLEQGVLAIAATCPMSAMTRRRLKNLVRAEPESGQHPSGDCPEKV